MLFAKTMFCYLFWDLILGFTIFNENICLVSLVQTLTGVEPLQSTCKFCKIMRSGHKGIH